MVFAVLACGCTGADSNLQSTKPAAVIDVQKTSSHILVPIEFDGSRSVAPNGSITEFKWDFGDGQSAVGAIATHTYSETGEYTVTLTVTDDDGISEAASIGIRTYVQSAGYYTGTAMSAVTGESTPIEVIIGANNVIHAFDYENLRTSYWGNVAAADTRVTGDLSAELRDLAFVFPDGSSVGTVNIDAVIEPGQLISGSFTGAADSGIVDVSYVKRLAERPSSLNSISGNWYWNEATGFTASVMINERGRFDYSDTNGCRGSGRLRVLDPSLNGFDFHARWNCPESEDPRWNGTGQGIVFVDDYYSPGVHRLVFAESTWNGSSSVWTVERTATGHSPQQVAEPIVAENQITPMREGRHQSL